MAKQVKVTLSAQDQLSPTFLAAARNILGVGVASDKATSQAAAAFRKMGSAASVVKTAVAGLFGAFAVRSAFRGLDDAAQKLNRIQKISRSRGVGVEWISQLSVTSELAGVSLDGLVDGLTTAQKNIGQFAQTGVGRAAEAIKMLGVRFKDAEGNVRPIQELLPEIADAINAIPDAERRLFASSKIFGENADFLNVIAEGGDRLRSFNNEAKRLGAAFTPEQTALAEQYRDSIERIGIAWLGFRVRVLEKVGPLLTNLNNDLAKFVAALPDIIGNLFNTVSEAIGNQGNARERLTAFFDSLLDVATIGVRGITTVAIAGAIEGAGFLFDQLEAFVETRAARLAVSLGTRVEIQLNKTVGDIARIIGDSEGALQTERRLREIDRERALAVQERASSPSEAAEAFRRFTRGNDIPATRAAIANLRAELGDAASAFSDAADNVLGFRAALSATREETRAVSGTLAVPVEAVSSWREFFDGLKQGFRDLKDRQRSLYEEGQELAGQVVSTISSGFATAFVETIQNVRNFADAWMKAFASIAQSIAQVLAQMAATRIVTSVLGSLFSGVAGAAGAGASAGAASATPAGPGGFAPVGTAFGAGGGLFNGRRFVPMAAGGMAGVFSFVGGGGVPGPDVRRDVVPAMLMPREYVVSRRGTDVPGNVEALAYANRGGRVVPEGGGGGGVHVSITVNVSGGGEITPQAVAAIKQAAQAGVLEGLQRNVGYRGAVRGALS